MFSGSYSPACAICSSHSPPSSRPSSPQPCASSPLRLLHLLLLQECPLEEGRRGQQSGRGSAQSLWGYVRLPHLSLHRNLSHCAPWWRAVASPNLPDSASVEPAFGHGCPIAGDKDARQAHSCWVVVVGWWEGEGVREKEGESQIFCVYLADQEGPTLRLEREQPNLNPRKEGPTHTPRRKAKPQPRKGRANLPLKVTHSKNGGPTSTSRMQPRPREKKANPHSKKEGPTPTCAIEGRTEDTTKVRKQLKKRLKTISAALVQVTARYNERLIEMTSRFKVRAVRGIDQQLRKTRISPFCVVLSSLQEPRQ